MPNFIIPPNLVIYNAIAKDSLAESDRIRTAQMRPKPNGEKGYIINYDPESKSFKHSLIAIVFAGIYLEALLYIKIVKRFGKTAYDKIDRSSYEKKLELLGITDLKLLNACKHFRTIRKELVHEKIFHQNESGNCFAQDEAHKAIDLIDQITDLLKGE
jgi:hypothetical protein